MAKSWSQDSPTFSTNVRVVSLLATVRDRDGKVVKDLSQDHFVLQEDGTPQTIRYFSRESNLPLTIGLLVDTSRSQVSALEPERLASYTFLDQVLREDKDRAFVVQFNVKVEMLQGLTTSRRELTAALDRLRVPRQIATLLFSAVRDSATRRYGISSYSQIEDDLRNQYSIGYTPQRPLGDGKYRKIRLTTKDRTLTVTTRDGYYAN